MENVLLLLLLLLPLWYITFVLCKFIVVIDTDVEFITFLHKWSSLCFELPLKNETTCL